MSRTINDTFKKAWNWRLKKKWHVIPVSLLIFTVIYVVFSNFHFTLTDSLDEHVFLIDTRFPQIKRGDYVTLDVTYPYGKVPEDIYVTKEVGCLPGQLLEVKGLSFYCDGTYLGSAKEETMSGKKTKVFKYDGLIPYGKLFLTGPHQYSFDSRYFGLVEVTKLKMLLKPVF